jgi:phage shock protein PspC (stress-responsive transcriptional regulator)
MNKVITINLGGNAYQLEEGGYEVLRSYLETATARLEGNPDRGEILSDIEGAIAEKFRSLLNSRKTVVEKKEVETVLAEMGPIDADADAGATSGNPTSSASGKKTTGEERATGGSGTPRRLYRIEEGAMLAGVCNGIAAHFNTDPTFVRLAFVFLTLLWGTGLLVYIVMAIVIPKAQSPEEKAAAAGSAPTAQEFIQRAKEGYYEAMKGFPDRKARREWQRRFKREMRAHTDQWSCNWHRYWTEHPPIHPGLGFTLSFLSLVQGAVTILWMCAFVSLLATGAVFGLALPASVPVWLAAILLFIAYGIVVGPLKVTRRLYFWGLRGAKGSGSFLFLLDMITGIVVAAILLCLAFHYFPEVRQAVDSIPALAHQAADDINAWWKGK